MLPLLSFPLELPSTAVQRAFASAASLLMRPINVPLIREWMISRHWRRALWEVSSRSPLPWGPHGDWRPGGGSGLQGGSDSSSDHAFPPVRCSFRAEYGL